MLGVHIKQEFAEDAQDQQVDAGEDLSSRNSVSRNAFNSETGDTDDVPF